MAGPFENDPSVWDVVCREVTPWRVVDAQPAQIDAETGRHGPRTTSVADDTRAHGSSRETGV